MGFLMVVLFPRPYALLGILGVQLAPTAKVISFSLLMLVGLWALGQ